MTAAMLISGLVLAVGGELAFLGADKERTAAGGFGSGVSPSTRRVMAVVVIVFGFALAGTAIASW